MALSLVFFSVNLNILYCAIKPCQIEMNEQIILLSLFQMPCIIIGGTTATGKTSTAKKLHELYNWDYLEADDFHSQSNIEKMHAGIPLTDEDRLPWLISLHEQLEKYSSTNRSCILTCSALRKMYRQILLTGSADPNIKAKIPTEDIYFIMLTLSREELYKRLVQRQHEHFMNPALLDSQLQLLELPQNQADEPHTFAIRCDGLSTDEVVQQIQKIIKQ
jgi:carbohydrate kinase (thermoresistant glucokinase family)